MLIGQSYGRDGPDPYTPEVSVDTTVPYPDLIVGLELEIENFNEENERYFPGVEFTEDGSLRNSDRGMGIEAITLPLQTKYVRNFLEEFFSRYEISNSNYSERCSVHVHVNVNDMSYEQLASLCLVYQTVEDLLFSYVDSERANSIFCVPWNQCNLNYSIADKLIEYLKTGVDPFRNWQKYSALNLIPVMSQGSVEFRHLEGTCDVGKIMGWVSLLSCMMKYVVETPLQNVKENIIRMNTVSNYHDWLTSVFGKYTNLLRSDSFEKKLSRGVVDTKLALVRTKKSNWKDFTLRDIPIFAARQHTQVIGNTIEVTYEEAADREDYFVETPQEPPPAPRPVPADMWAEAINAPERERRREAEVRELMRRMEAQRGAR